MSSLDELRQSLNQIDNSTRELDKKYASFHETQQNLKKQLKSSKKTLKALKKSVYQSKNLDDLEKLHNLENQINCISDNLPKNNSRYLRAIIGDHLNVILPGVEARKNYKIGYENFKLRVNSIIFLFTVSLIWSNYYLVNKTRKYQLFQMKTPSLSPKYGDPLFLALVRIDIFLNLWYYSTLTVRESILIANGSRIKGWWVVHHYISIILCGVCITIPNGSEEKYVMAFLFYLSYNSVISLLQFTYQKAALYGLRATGNYNRKNDKSDNSQELLVTTDLGFTFSVAKFMSLGKLLPFLFFAYFLQFYNAFVLIQASVSAFRDRILLHWQVPVLGGLFLMLGLGNSVTMLQVLRQKYQHNKDALGRKKSK